jgi:rfaE bifunctional protein kinase chain/domain
MNIEQLESILAKLKDISILVLGDYFLDKYLLLDPALNEKSIETGLTAYQAAGKKLNPGAAGTVTNNLRALGVGKVMALGVAGEDGEGFELIKGLQATGVLTDNIIITAERFTPTYIKPMVLEKDVWSEINRIDIKNRMPTPGWIEDLIIERLLKLSCEVDAFVVMDQVTEKDCGTVTGRVRKTLIELGNTRSDLVIYADSRAYTYFFDNILIKCNHHELLKAFHHDSDNEHEEDLIRKCGVMLSLKNSRPVFVTIGSKGQIVFDGEKVTEIPAVPAEGPFDICGAGDATTSGIISALCCGAGYCDAALLGNTVASITIQQLGTTGTASPEQVLARFREFKSIK